MISLMQRVRSSVIDFDFNDIIKQITIVIKGNFFNGNIGGGSDDIATNIDSKHNDKGNTN